MDVQGVSVDVYLVEAGWVGKVYLDEVRWVSLGEDKWLANLLSSSLSTSFDSDTKWGPSPI
jgi:hypothetical protein